MEVKNIEKKEEVKNETQEIKRPWQGIFMLVLFMLVFIYGIIPSSTDFVIEDVFYPAVGIFGIWAFWKGKKSFIVVLMALFVLLLLTALVNIFVLDLPSGYPGSYFENIVEFLDKDNIIFILISVFSLYFSITCLKHPFYNQKKVK